MTEPPLGAGKRHRFTRRATQRPSCCPSARGERFVSTTRGSSLISPRRPLAVITKLSRFRFPHSEVEPHLRALNTMSRRTDRESVSVSLAEPPQLRGGAQG